MLISLYTSRVVLDVLGETDFGIYNLVGGIIVLFSFMTNAMSTATQRFLNYELGKNDINQAHKVFSMSITTHILIALIIFVIGETLGLWFVITKLNIPACRFSSALWVYHLSIIGCCLSVLRIPYNASVVAYERMSFYAYASIIDALLRLLIAIILVKIGTDKLILYAILMLSVLVILNIVYYIYCKKHFTICHYEYSWDKSLFKEILSFSGWSMTGSLANVGANQGIGILLNIFHGVSLNAALGIANQVQSAVSSFVSSFQTAFTPQIVKTYTQEDKTTFYKIICRSSRLSYCLVFIIAPALIVCLDPILNLWLTDVPKYTNSFVTVFVIYIMIDAMSGPLWVSVQAKGNIRNYQLLMSTLIVLNIPIMLILLVCGVSPVYVVAIRAILNFITHLVRIEYLRMNLSFPTTIYWREVMLRCFTLTVISLPVCFTMSGLVRSGRFYVLSAMLIVIAINTFLVVFIGLNNNEKRAFLKVAYNKFQEYKRLI